MKRAARGTSVAAGSLRGAPPDDPSEVARFLRPQPPVPVPPRTYAPQLPGLLAYALLGARVVTRYQQE